MADARENFVRIVSTILARFLRQEGKSSASAEALAHAAGNLWTLVETRGLPRPLTPAERGEPGEMPDDEVIPLVDFVIGGVAPDAREALRAPIKQLVKACFYPEFKTCRDSFREVSPDGSCRRQELARVRARVSGSHCVDCPHWVALTPEKHVKYLAREWKAGAEAFAAHQEIFLPEDFRELRTFLYARAREIGRT